MKKHFFNAIISTERLKFDANTQKDISHFLQLIRKGDKLQAEVFRKSRKEVFAKYLRTAKSECEAH